MLSMKTNVQGLSSSPRCVVIGSKRLSEGENWLQVESVVRQAGKGMHHELVETVRS